MRYGRTTGLAAGLLIAAAVFWGTISGLPHVFRQEYVGTITDKIVKRYGDRDKYLIFTMLEDDTVRVFQNIDSKIFELKWNSSDIQAELQEGRTYRFETYGLRVPFFSWYENIVGFEDITPENTSSTLEEAVQTPSIP